MNILMLQPEAPQLGRVVTVTRRYAAIVDAEGRKHNARTASCHIELCVGDFVAFNIESKSEDEHSGASISAALPRKNCLKRQDGRRTKELAANVDLVLVVTAPPPLFNPSVIDRVLAAAHEQHLRAALVLNKIDLLPETSLQEELMAAYRTIDLPIFPLSAKENCGIEEFRTILHKPELEAIVLVGVSGVGKSSLIRAFDPGFVAKTQEVSARTGQGKQTTSQAMAHSLGRNERSPLFIIDLPGIQNFGICHLSDEQVREAFPEFHEPAAQCQFTNCWHLQEPACKVQVLLGEKKISESRFRSYREMLEETRRTKKY